METTTLFGEEPGQGASALLRVPQGQAGLQIPVFRQLTPKSCYPLGESTSFPPKPPDGRFGNRRFTKTPS